MNGPGVKIKIAMDGEITMDYHGYRGDDCHLKEARLRDLLSELNLQKVVENKKMLTDDRMELEKA